MNANTFVEKEMESLAQEEGILSQEEHGEPVAHYPQVSRSIPGRKALVAMLALGALCVVGYQTTLQQPQVNHAKSFYTKLRAKHVIRLNLAKHPNQQMLKEVGNEAEGALAAQEFKDAGYDIEEKGNNIAPHQGLKQVKDLGFTKLDMNHVKEMFDELDGDNDGEISEPELATIMNTIEDGTSPADIHEAFEMAGPEREAPMFLVNFKEFANFQADMKAEEMGDDMAKEPPSMDHAGEVAKMVMKDADVDKNQMLGPLELEAFFVQTIPVNELPIGKTIHDVSALLMRMFDEDKDGYLGMAELTAMLKEVM